MSTSVLAGSFLALYHSVQTLVAGYTSILSYKSIRRVQTYEEMAEKAARYSSVANNHLQTTRTTQGSGALSILLSMLSSVYLLYKATKGSGAADEIADLVPTQISFGLSVVTALALSLSYRHITGYWRDKFKIPLPGSGDYNDAITSTNQVRQGVELLAWTWGAVAVVYGLMAQSEYWSR